MVNASLIACGHVETAVVKFEFCPLWNGFLKTAVFYRSEAEVYSVLLNENSEATIPKEVLQKEGLFYYVTFSPGSAKQSQKNHLLCRCETKVLPHMKFCLQ